MRNDQTKDAFPIMDDAVLDQIIFEQDFHRDNPRPAPKPAPTRKELEYEKAEAILNKASNNRELQAAIARIARRGFYIPKDFK